MSKPQPVSTQVVSAVNNSSEAQASQTQRADQSDAPKVVFVPFAYENTVQVEDASQFSRFAMEYFGGRGLAEFRQSAPVLKDATEFVDGLKSPAADWAWRHGVEYITSGIVHEYSYKADSRNLNMAVDFTLNVLQASDLTQVYSKRQKVSRSFRVNASANDYSSQNRQMLEELLGRFERDLRQLKSNKPATVVQVPKVSEPAKSVSVWGEVTDPQLQAREIRQEEKQSDFTVVRLPEVQEPEVQTVKAEPNSRIEELRNRLREFATKPQITRLPEVAPTKSEPVVTVKVAQQPKKPEVVNKSLVAEGLLDLRMDGFVLAHPQVMDPQKRYEKFFYLPKTSASEEETLKSFDMASKSNLTIEVFSTISEYAVRKFLIDYFEGLPANPTGRIPEAYERTQMGKYQLGFMIGKRAFVVTSPREQRDGVLAASGSFFVRNGGHDLNQILSGKQAPQPANTIQMVQKVPKPLEVTKPVEVAKPVEPVAAPAVTVVSKPAAVTKPVVNKPAVIDSPSSVIAAHIKSEKLLQELEYEDTPQPRSTISKKEVAIRPEAIKTESSVVSEAERIASLLEDIRLPSVAQTAPRPLNETRPAMAEEIVQVDVVIQAETRQTVAQAPQLSEVSKSDGLATGKEEALKHSSRKGLIEDFYAEMEKIEAELEQVRARRTGLMTIGSSSGHISLWELFFQGIMLIGLGVMVFAFVRERKLR